MNQTMNLAPARNRRKVIILSGVNYGANLYSTKVPAPVRNFSLSKFAIKLLRALFCDKACGVFCCIGILAMWVFVCLEDINGIFASCVAMMPWIIAFIAGESKKGGAL